MVSFPRQSMRGRLGCGQNEAAIFWKGGRPLFCRLPDTSEVRWGRRLDDISEASVVVPVSATDEDCFSCLSLAEPWCHELHIIRDGRTVWVGPIIDIEYQLTQVEIRAQDLLAWTAVRIPEIDINFAPELGGTSAELSLIAETILNIAFVEDDPNVLEFISRTDTGLPPSTRFFPAFADTCFSYLDQVSNTGLDYTVVGRTIVIGPEDIPTAPIVMLTDRMILGEVMLTKMGNFQATRWYVQFDGSSDVIPPGPAIADTHDSHCAGVIERLRGFEDSLFDKESAEVAGRILVNATAIAPRVIEIPEGSRLSPDAPWDIMDMIPGARVDVGITRLPVDAVQSYRLVEMDVIQVPGDEEVHVTLGPVNVLGDD